MTNALNYRTITSAALACALAIAPAGIARADLAAASDGYSLGVDVRLVSNLVGIGVGPTAFAGGMAPDAYNASHTVLSVSASALGVASLSTGVLSANATSDITFGSSGGFAHGNGTVDDLLLRVVPGLLPALDLVRLEAETIGSHATVSFDGLNFSLNGGIVIEDALLRVLGVGSLSVLASASPNTVLLDAAGIRIVLNEQIMFNDGLTASLEVNAIRISIDSPLQIVTADVVIGHSFASMTIPTPGTLGLLASAGLLAGGRRRKA